MWRSFRSLRQQLSNGANARFQCEMADRFDPGQGPNMTPPKRQAVERIVMIRIDTVAREQRLETKQARGGQALAAELAAASDDEDFHFEKVAGLNRQVEPQNTAKKPVSALKRMLHFEDQAYIFDTWFFLMKNGEHSSCTLKISMFA